MSIKSQAPDIIITNPALVVGRRRCDSNTVVPTGVMFLLLSASLGSQSVRSNVLHPLDECAYIIVPYASVNRGCVQMYTDVNSSLAKYLINAQWVNSTCTCDSQGYNIQRNTIKRSFVFTMKQ